VGFVGNGRGVGGTCTTLIGKEVNVFEIFVENRERKRAHAEV
jgi:hypothetical protein